ncbi:hypothetical protein [Cupriavidus plantarum]|uniref:hypothetical protein n=1 Tax=Cupriavidus plantarum TaxID=942865 RepID=UPI000E2699B4|nr:hypothetical protein [Cupriavidus plantarum]REE93341.1 hypothetical protein C7418_2105 [Cupriavidus plantarum]CAG2137313.1 hypothetical protein LMG26296_02521 [Cupriavidus plantarum]SMR84896.1 hypothetical protein SAMN05421735_3691 [Cupriavidus plantarum]
MADKISGGNTAYNVGGAAGDYANSKVGMDGNTASAIAQINAAAEAMNAINLATTLAQLKEAGPKNAKSLTQG